MNKNYPLNEVKKVDSVKDLMRQATEEAGDKIAFMYKEGKENIEVTYAKFQEDTIALGTAITELGLNDKHIACIGDNSYKWLTTYLTVLKSDGVFVPVDKELPIEDIINILKSSDSEILFYAEKYEKYVEQILREATNIKFLIGFSRKEESNNVLSYDRFIEDGRKSFNAGNQKYLKLKSDPNSLKLLVYTSGTTGMAKGVMLTENNLISCVYYGLQVATVYSRCLSVLPYHHTYEGVAGILVALHHHSTICINDSLKNVLKNLQFYKPDYIYVVPAFAELFYKKIISNAKENKKYGIMKTMIVVSNALRKIGIDVRKKLFKAVHNAFGGNLREIVCGGAPIRPEVGKFFDDIGIDLLNGYGITECSPLVSVNRPYFNDCRTVGVVLPCCEVKIVNPDEDGNGEVHVKGKIVMLGYYNDEERTNEVLKDGWFNTGDYGNINKKGQLSITGRKKNLIVLNNGKNVFPEEIEAYVARVPYVQEVVVRGIKEDGREVGLQAEVFLNQDMVKSMGIEDVHEALKKDISNVTKELPVYKKVTDIKIRENEFVKTTTNKIKR